MALDHKNLGWLYCQMSKELKLQISSYNIYQGVQISWDCAGTDIIILNALPAPV